MSNKNNIVNVKSEAIKNQTKAEIFSAAVPARLCEEQTYSTLSGSWMFVMLTVPLQGCWEIDSLSSTAASPDSELLSSFSLATSASRAERFSPETENIS